MRDSLELETAAEIFTDRPRETLNGGNWR